MSRSPQRELFRKLRALTPEQASEVQAYIHRLKSGPPVREAQTGDVDPTSRGLETAQAQTLTDDGHGQSSQERRRGPDDTVTETCNFWGRRPLHALADDQLQPIAALMREALDQRDARRQRFG